MSTEKPRVFVTRRLPQEILDSLDAHFEVDLWDSDLPPDVDSLRERVAPASRPLLPSDRQDRRGAAGRWPLPCALSATWPLALTTSILSQRRREASP